MTVKASSLTSLTCKAQSASKTSSKSASYGLQIQRAYKLCQRRKEARAELTAGHWIRDRKKRFTCMVYVSNHAAVDLSKKDSASAFTSSNSTGPSSHGFQFDLSTQKTVTGCLTLRISSLRAKGASARYEITILGDGFTKRLTSSTARSFQKLVLPKVSIGSKGLHIQIRSYAQASLKDKGHSFVLSRATVQFDVKKS